LTVYVVRVAGTIQTNIRASDPCLDCFNKMKELGIKKIVYSCEGSYVKCLLNNYIPTRICLGRAFISSGMKPITRANIDSDALLIKNAYKND